MRDWWIPFGAPWWVFLTGLIIAPLALWVSRMVWNARLNWTIRRAIKRRRELR
jgi:hypothetical protein